MQLYQQPQIELVTFDTIDILTASGIDLPDLPLSESEI